MDNSIIPTSVRAQGPSSSGTPPAPRLMAGRHRWWPPLSISSRHWAWTHGLMLQKTLFFTLPFFPSTLPPPPHRRPPPPPEHRWSVITLHSIQWVCYEVSVLARLLFGWWMPSVRALEGKLVMLGLFFPFFFVPSLTFFLSRETCHQRSLFASLAGKTENN